MDSPESQPAGEARLVLEIGHPVLRGKAEPVPPEAIGSADVQALIDDLVATMRAAHGAGLAANQIGVLQRVCVIEVADNPRYPYKPRIPLTVLVNPELTPLGPDRFENNEGCLSVPGLRGNVMRHTEVEVTALDRRGERIQITARGLTAGTFQHECDHLDGVLFVDRVSDPRTLSTWREFDAHHRAAYLERVADLIIGSGQQPPG